MKNKKPKTTKRNKQVTIDIKYKVNTKSLREVTAYAEKAQAAVDKLRVALQSLA